MLRGRAFPRNPVGVFDMAESNGYSELANPGETDPAPQVQPEDEGEELDLPEDVYGAAIFSICYDSFEIFGHSDFDGLHLSTNIYRVLFVFCLLFVNYAMQIGLLVWIYRYVAMPTIRDTQTIYQKFHAEMYEDGVFRKDVWETWEHRADVCNISFSNFWFMYTILNLWWITMLIEVRKTERLWRKFQALPDTSDVDKVIRVVDGTNLVCRLTFWIRAMLYGLLLFPKLVIVVILLYVGSIWLLATVGVTNLVLNAIALGFVIGIDEILFGGFIPESMSRNLDITKLFIPSDPNPSVGSHVKAVVKGYTRSTLYLIVVAVGVYLWMTQGQSIPLIGVFPGYSYDVNCVSYWTGQATQVCKLEDTEVTTQGIKLFSGDECFPLG